MSRGEGERKGEGMGGGRRGGKCKGEGQGRRGEREEGRRHDTFQTRAVSTVTCLLI